MEPDPRTKAGAHRLRPLNQPQPVRLQAAGGLPRAVALRGRWLEVARVEEVWRVEEGWWRPQPLRRTYFRLALADGRLLTVYRDHLEGGWWTQRC